MLYSLLRRTTRTYQSIYTQSICQNEVISASRAFSSSQNPKLAYEWIVDGKVMSAQEETNKKYSDRGVIVFLHGLLGNRKVRSCYVVPSCQPLFKYYMIVIIFYAHVNFIESTYAGKETN